MRVALHQDALGALDQRAAAERAFEVVIFGEAAKHDFDRALPVLDVASQMWANTPRLDASLTNPGSGCVQQHDHRAGGLAHDLVDQFKRVLRTFAEPDERDVGPLPRGHGADVLDVDLAGDHLVAERDHDRSDERETVLALVGDQNAQMIMIVPGAVPRADSRSRLAANKDGHSNTGTE